MISRIPLALAAAAALAAGCDRLATEPGQDFAVRVLTPMPITAIGKITVPVRFAVDGCSAFDVSVRGGDGASHPVESARQADGTHLVDLPVEWLREEGRSGWSCTDDALRPHDGTAHLQVTCRDAGRAAGADLPVSYGAASRAYGWNGPFVQYLFPSADPLNPYSIQPTTLEGVAYLHGAQGLVSLGSASLPFHQDLTATVDLPLARPRLVVAPSMGVFVSAGCHASSCPYIAGGPVADGSELLWGVSADAGGALTGEATWRIQVPQAVLDVALAGNGDLIVLSQVGWKSGSVVTRVTPALPVAPGDPRRGTAEVQVIGAFSGERVESRLSRTADGKLAFASLVIPELAGPVHTVLHTTDGQTVDSVADPTGDLYVGERWMDGLGFAMASLALAPDATAIVAEMNYSYTSQTYEPGVTYLGPPGAAFRALPTSARYSYDFSNAAGAVWLPDTVALWRGDDFLNPAFGSWDFGTVETFDAAPPHPRLYRYDLHPLPGSKGGSRLYGAIAVGDHLVLTTNTGVRILDRDGTLVGGADPLPCGLSPTALAIQSGPTTAAVGAGPYVYVFDLADLP